MDTFLFLPGWLKINEFVVMSSRRPALPARCTQTSVCMKISATRAERLHRCQGRTAHKFLTETVLQLQNIYCHCVSGWPWSPAESGNPHQDCNAATGGQQSSQNCLIHHRTSVLPLHSAQDNKRTAADTPHQSPLSRSLCTVLCWSPLDRLLVIVWTPPGRHDLLAGSESSALAVCKYFQDEIGWSAAPFSAGQNWSFILTPVIYQSGTIKILPKFREDNGVWSTATMTRNWP